MGKSCFFRYEGSTTAKFQGICLTQLEVFSFDMLGSHWIRLTWKICTNSEAVVIAARFPAFKTKRVMGFSTFFDLNVLKMRQLIRG